MTIPEPREGSSADKDPLAAATDLEELHGEAQRHLRWGASGVAVSLLGGILAFQSASAAGAVLFILVFCATLVRLMRWRHCQDEIGRLEPGTTIHLERGSEGAETA